MLNFLLVFALSNSIYGKRAKTEDSLFEIYYDNRLVLEKFDLLILESNNKQEHTVPFHGQDEVYYNGIVIKPILQEFSFEKHLIVKFEISNHNNKSIKFIPQVIVKGSINVNASRSVIHQNNGFLLDDVAILSYFDEFIPEYPSRSYFGNNDRSTLIFEWKPFDMKCNDEVTLNLHIVPTNSLKTSKRQIKQYDSGEGYSEVDVSGDGFTGVDVSGDGFSDVDVSGGDSSGGSYSDGGYSGGSYYPGGDYNYGAPRITLEGGFIHNSVHNFEKPRFKGKITYSHLTSELTGSKTYLYYDDYTIEYNTTESIEVDVTIDFPIENKNQSYDVRFQVMNNYISSNILIAHFDVLISPSVYFSESLKNIYNVGDELQVNAFLGDYEPGTYLALGYHFGEEGWRHDNLDYNTTSLLMVGDNWKTNETLIKIDLPKDAKTYYLYTFGIDGNLDIKNMRVERIWVNEKPNVTEWKPIKLNYSSNEYIDIEAKVYDDSTTFLKYIFDDNTSNSDQIGWVICNRLQSIITAQIPIPSSIESGEHYIDVYAQDLYNLTSEKHRWNFTMISQSAPVLKMSRSSLNDLYGYSDIIKFTGVVHDADPNDTIYVEVDNGTNRQQIKTINSQNQDHQITYEIDNPHVDKDFTLTFRAHDDKNAYSRKISFPVSIRRKREIIITSPIKEKYELNATIKIHGYVTDFEMNETITISYMINGVITQLNDKKFTMSTSFKSQDFDFEMQLPSNAGMNNVLIWAESSSNKKTYNKFYNILTNSKPKINEWLDFNEEIYDNEYYPIKLNITSESAVKPCIWSTCFDAYKKPNEQGLIQWNFISKNFSNLDAIDISIVDEFGFKSESISKEISFDIFSSAPKILFPSNDGVNEIDLFRNQIVFSLDIFGDATIFTRITSENNDVNEWEFLDEIQSEDETFSKITRQYSMPTPNISGKYTLMVIAKDNENHSSIPIEKHFRVERGPSVDVKSTSSKDYFIPNENVTFECSIFDFPPNSTAKLYYAFDTDQDHSNLVNETKINAQGNSNQISFTIQVLNDNKEHYLMIWAEAQSVKSQTWGKFMNLDQAPKLVLHNPETETLTRPAYIYLSLSVLDEGVVDIYYKINNSQLIKKTYIESYGNNKSILQEIKYDSDTSSEFELLVYAQDSKQHKSEFVSKKIKYDASRSSPNIDQVGELTKQDEYRWSDSITISFHIHDTINNSVYDILYRYGSSSFQSYKKVKNSEDIQKDGVICNIPAYKKNGGFSLLIQIVREDGAKSNIAQLLIAIRKKPSIAFPENLNDSYDIKRTNILKIQLRDFEKNSKVSFTMSINDEKTFSNIIDIEDSYHSDDFKVPLPNLTTGNYKINFIVKYNSKVLAQTEKNIVFKFAPKFRILNKERKKFAMNDHMNIYFSIQDSYPVDIICEIENITKYIKKDFNPNGREVYIYEQIFFDNVTIKSLGKDQDVNIRVYAQDKFGMKSEITNYSKNFILEAVAPVMRANSDIGDTLSWYDRPQINAVILAPIYNKNQIKVIFRVNFNHIIPIKIYDYNSKGAFEKATLTLNDIPHKNGEFQLSIIAQSDGDYSSAFYSKIVKIQKTPHIVLDQLKDHYEPNEEVTISGYAVDLDAGMNVDIFYSAEGSSSRSALSSQKLITSYIYPNFTSSKFSFIYRVPEMQNYKGIQIWAESGGHKVAELNNQKDIINYQPKIKIISDVRKEYYDQSSFFFHAKVKDINNVKIFYIIDRSSETSLTDWIECTGSEVTVNSLEIPLLSSQIELGNHRIQIYCRDSNGDMSNVFIYDFVLISQKAPQFKIIESNADQIFSTSDVLTLNCQYLDEYVGHNISLCYTINNNGEILAFSETNDQSEWKTAYLTIVLPYQTNEIVVYALDRTNQVRSISKRMTIKVENNPRVDLEPIILSDSDDRLPGFEYKVYPYRAQLREILPTDTPILSSESYYFEFSGKSFSIQQKPAREEYTIGKFVKDYLQTEKDGDLIIKLKDTKSQITKQFRQKLIFNKAPTLELVKPMEIKIFENGYIDALLKVSGERPVDIYSSIDSTSPMILANDIKLNGSSKTMRKQIRTGLHDGPNTNDNIDSIFSKHKITFYAVDIHGFKSKQLENTVYYYNSNPPSLEMSDKPITCTGHIEIEGSVDSSINDDISVYIQKDDFSFDKIHYCPSSSRPQCQSFKYNISKPKDDKLIFQSRGTQGATSKDIVFSYAEVADNCKLLEKFIENSSPSENPINITNNIESGFFDTIFGKYILWPLLAVIILAIVAGVVIFIYIKKKKETISNSNNNTNTVEDEEPPEVRIDDFEKLNTTSESSSSEFDSNIANPLYSIPVIGTDDGDDEANIYRTI